MLKNRILPLCLVIVFIFCLFAGCTININIGNPAENTTKETNRKNIFEDIFNSGDQTVLYQSRATVYISNKASAESPSISSDLSASKSLTETYAVILNTEIIQSKIQEEYPDLKYELTLESINETEVFAIIATGENPEYLDEICNMAASLLCEMIPQILEGSSGKIVDYAKPAQLVETN